MNNATWNPHGDSPWGIYMGIRHGESSLGILMGIPPWGFPMGNPHGDSPWGLPMETPYIYPYVSLCIPICYTIVVIGSMVHMFMHKLCFGPDVHV